MWQVQTMAKSLATTHCNNTHLQWFNSIERKQNENRWDLRCHQFKSAFGHHIICQGHLLTKDYSAHLRYILFLSLPQVSTLLSHLFLPWCHHLINHQSLTLCFCVFKNQKKKINFFPKNLVASVILL